ncbi:Glutamate--tRNA ligase [Candidatus Tiddalikarchaeum anstoanum]|nr:Glutamate--tRNA ligase [Candidatus Tiddalikarchaeum anstoanum]
MKESDILKHALRNAALHDGKAVVGAVIPKILGEDPKLKSKMKELMPAVSKIVEEVNKLSLEKQKAELLTLDKHALDKKEEEAPKELPELKNIKVGKCSFRIPPGPEKELHIGHALSFLLNYYYAKRYKGKLILRFEDTNPEKCRQEFVNGIKQDLTALGITWDEEYYMSDHLPEYYKLAEKMIKKGDVYICNCVEDKISKDRENHVRCGCAEKDVNGNLREWNKMKYGTYKEGTCVLRLKGDLKNKNSVMWDPSLFRINRTKHYRQGSKFFVWPLYDFTAAVEDAKITHVLRDSNWTQRVELQDFIRKKLGIKGKPVNVLYSRYQLEGAVTQGRIIRKLVEDKVVDGYDDIRLATVKGLLRRGFVPETFMQILIEMGISKSQRTIPLEKLYSINSRILDKKVDRYFFVEDPVLLTVNDAPGANVELPMTPYDAKRTRKVDTEGEFYIPKRDAKTGLVLLKYAYNVKIIKVTPNGAVGEYVIEKTIKDVPIIQWIAKNNEVPIIVKEPLPMFNDKEELNKVTMAEHKGFAERIVEGLPVGAQVQFERFAFCKKDKDYWNFTHK